MNYKDYLKLTSTDIAKMTEGELRAIISDLNDVANKRVKRLSESGLAIASPEIQILRESGKKKFSIGRNVKDKRALKEAYSQVRNFLQAKTSTLTGTRKFTKGLKGAIDDVINKAMEDQNNLDKRYKNPTLRKKVRDKVLTNFWKEYNKWAEISRNKNPSSWQTGSPIERVGEFYEEYYEKGLRTETDYEEGETEKYEQEQETGVQIGEIDGRGVEVPFKVKYKTERGKRKGEPLQRFEQIKLF